VLLSLFRLRALRVIYQSWARLSGLYAVIDMKKRPISVRYDSGIMSAFMLALDSEPENEREMFLSEHICLHHS
jgi:hypothetical protein